MSEPKNNLSYAGKIALTFTLFSVGSATFSDPNSKARTYDMQLNNVEWTNPDLRRPERHT